MGAVWLPMLVAFAVVRVPFTIVDATPFLQAIVIAMEIKRMHWECAVELVPRMLMVMASVMMVTRASAKRMNAGCAMDRARFMIAAVSPFRMAFAIAMAHQMQTTMAFVMTSMTASAHRMSSVYATARVRPMRMETGSVTTMEGTTVMVSTMPAVCAEVRGPFTTVVAKTSLPGSVIARAICRTVKAIVRRSWKTRMVTASMTRC